MDVVAFFAKAAGLTVILTALGFGLGFVLLGVNCMGVLHSQPLRRTTLLFCKIFQTVPFLILLFWIYFGWGHLSQRHLGLTLSPMVAGVLALSVSFFVFAAEAMIRALNHLDGGLLKSAESLDIRGWHLYRSLLLPVLWAQLGGLMANLLLMLMKESALISALGVFELTRAGQIYSEMGENYFAGTLISLAMYWGLAEILQRSVLKKVGGHA